jgi:hypothetical protein
MNAWEARGYIVRYWIPRVPSEATKGKIKGLNKGQKKQKTHQISRSDEGENHFLDFTFYRIVSLVCLSLVSNLFLFFSFVASHPVFELITFLFLRWPDCPDSGTSTAPLCRLIVEELSLVIKVLRLWWGVGLRNGGGRGERGEVVGFSGGGED